MSWSIVQLSSSPAKCEQDEALAMSANCPLNFLEALHACVPDCLLIHFSTDLVLPDDEKPCGDGGVGAKSSRGALLRHQYQKTPTADLN